MTQHEAPDEQETEKASGDAAEQGARDADKPTDTSPEAITSV